MSYKRTYTVKLSDASIAAGKKFITFATWVTTLTYQDRSDEMTDLINWIKSTGLYPTGTVDPEAVVTTSDSESISFIWPSEAQATALPDYFARWFSRYEDETGAVLVVTDTQL
jgi:hypothetical protein